MDISGIWLSYLQIGTSEECIDSPLCDYAYDDMDRLTNICHLNPGPSISCSYSYTPAGYLTNKLYSNGVSAQYAYDAIGRMTGLTNRNGSGILDAYSCEYDKAQMITGITRGTNTVSFGYDNTYQLTSERGTYLSNFAPFVSFVVSNRFAYDRAGNRIFHSSINPSIHSSSYRHTADNQLTGIYWNSSKITLAHL